MIDSFVLLAYAIRQRLLTIISLPELYIQIYSVSTNEKKDFYELWQLHKKLKTRRISEV